MNDDIHIPQWLFIVMCLAIVLGTVLVTLKGRDKQEESVRPSFIVENDNRSSPYVIGNNSIATENFSWFDEQRFKTWYENNLAQGWK